MVRSQVPAISNIKNETNEKTTDSIILRSLPYELKKSPIYILNHCYALLYYPRRTVLLAHGSWTIALNRALMFLNVRAKVTKQFAVIKARFPQATNLLFV